MKYILSLIVGATLFSLIYPWGTREQLEDSVELGGAYLGRELRANELNNIQNKMESLKITHGEYTQVTLDGRILIHNGEIVDQGLINLLPANLTISVYSGPDGDGFQLIQTLSDRIVNYGFGAEAIERTYTVPLSAIPTL
jgi:hypothetical protein